MQVVPPRDALELPVEAHERAQIGLVTRRAAFLEHAHVPRSGIHAELLRKREGPVAEFVHRGVEALHAPAIGTGSEADETVPPDGVAGPADFAVVRPPTVIEPGRLIAGRHPCAQGRHDADAAVSGLRDAGVTLFLDLTQAGELEPYASLVTTPARYANRPIGDFSVPTTEALAATLDEIDAELARGGVVYVHCWAGCGRTGVVVGSWLVRHGLEPEEALRRVADARGRGCPQTLEQRTLVLGWQHGL